MQIRRNLQQITLKNRLQTTPILRRKRFLVINKQFHLMKRPTNPKLLISPEITKLIIQLYLLF